MARTPNRLPNYTLLNAVVEELTITQSLRLNDDVPLEFGTTTHDTIKYNSTSGNFEFTSDGAESHTTTSGFRQYSFAVGTNSYFYFDSRKVTTNDATTTTVYTVPIPNNCGVTIYMDIIGKKSDDTQIGCYGKVVSYRNTGGAVTIVGAVNNPYTSEDDAAWNTTASTVSGTNVLLRVVGVAATTIDWVCWVRVYINGE